nr:hypothetical transcript [Hymenolepis microstoma]
MGFTIDLPPHGAPWATYTHTAKKSINGQLTSKYHDPTVCHIQPLPQYSLYLFPYPRVCLFYICELLSCFTSQLFMTLMFLSSVKPEVNWIFLFPQHVWIDPAGVDGKAVTITTNRGFQAQKLNRVTLCNGNGNSREVEKRMGNAEEEEEGRGRVRKSSVCITILLIVVPSDFGDRCFSDQRF